MRPSHHNLTMEQEGVIKYLDTNAATVKMSSGVPYIAGLSIDSESDEDYPDENYVSPKIHNLNNNINIVSLPKNENVHKINGIVSSCLVSVTAGAIVEDKIKNLSSCGFVCDRTDSARDKVINNISNIDNIPATSITSQATNALKNTIDHNQKQSDSTQEKQVFIPKGYYWPTKNNGLQYLSSSDSLDNSTELYQSNDTNVPKPRQKKETKQAASLTPDSDDKLDAKIPSRQRMNPFNKYDLNVDEDHFSDSLENYFKEDRHSTNSTKSSVVSQGADWWQEANKSDVSFADLGLSEDHFSHPQGHFGLSCTEELELAIENCKEMIRDTLPGSDKQKNLIMKLIQLRIKLQEFKEGPEPVPENVKVILSHKMMLRSSRTSKYYCEKCNGVIWGMIQVSYRCTECGYRCHEKCLQQILRTCAKAKVLENPTLIMDINPKDPQGLMAQNYRCWECRSSISFKTGGAEPRLCDYSGRYYCELCHWNDTFVIPARVLHNWDFTPQKVCRASKQFLKLMERRAVIRINDVNPMLFANVEQLNGIKKLREEMMIMKKYILSCASAMSAKLLLLLESRQHFVESSDRYSMQDLLDSEDVLLPELVKIHSTWAQHIKVECELCKGRGFCCELCGAEEVLFPFDNIAVVCPKCCAVSHRHCFAKKGVCLRCERREKRHAEKL